MNTVTGNDSARVAAAVTCYGCGHNENTASSRSWAFGGDLHCTTCHIDGHRACTVCGSCLEQPDDRGRIHRQRRWDRFYCSGTCRVLAHRERRRADLERAVWEAEHPGEAATKRAEFEQVVASIRQSTELIDGPRRQGPGGDEWIEERHRLADRCAHVDRRKFGEEPVRLYRAGSDGEPAVHHESTRSIYTNVPCEVRFDGDEVVYRRHSRGLTSKILPYCAEHACEAFGHNRELEGTGRYYPNCCCVGDEYGERQWLALASCSHCGRKVRNHKAADPRRFVRQWQTVEEAQRKRAELAAIDDEDDRREFMHSTSYGPIVRTFCSEACRHAVFAVEARAKRLALRGVLERACCRCSRTFVPRRTDARYCSSACRQRAHRERHHA